jgi:quinoprotein glucose dehydrogenase
VIAVDAATGQQQWVYDPKVDLNGDYSEFSSRGVAAWPVGARAVAADPGSDSLRLFIGTIDGRLIALDAHTGLPVATFGGQGIVDLRAGLGENASEIQETSPPAVIGDLVIVGSSIGDNGGSISRRVSSGPIMCIRAAGLELGPYSPGSCRQRLCYLDRAEGPSDGSGQCLVDPQHRSGPRPCLCTDQSPSPDYYGGVRLGSNLYANSLVALRASTGKRVWSFQVVHHDLWDFDIAAQPVLIDFPRMAAPYPRWSSVPKWALSMS